MKTLTRDVVGKFARALITLKKETTTLDVKNALRDNDYWATQDQVREFMLDITSKDGDITYVESPYGYRIYSFVDDTAPITMPLSQLHTTIVVQSTVNKSVKPVTKVEKKANYRVTDRLGRYIAYFPNVTRSKAKHKWASMYGELYTNARATKVNSWWDARHIY